MYFIDVLSAGSVYCWQCFLLSSQSSLTPLSPNNLLFNPLTFKCLTCVLIFVLMIVNLHAIC